MWLPMFEMQDLNEGVAIMKVGVEDREEAGRMARSERVLILDSEKGGGFEPARIFPSCSHSRPFRTGL